MTSWSGKRPYWREPAGLSSQELAEALAEHQATLEKMTPAERAKHSGRQALKFSHNRAVFDGAAGWSLFNQLLQGREPVDLAPELRPVLATFVLQFATSPAQDEGKDLEDGWLAMRIWSLEDALMLLGSATELRFRKSLHVRAYDRPGYSVFTDGKPLVDDSDEQNRLADSLRAELKALIRTRHTRLRGW
jgi:hypothetical protein